MGKRNFDVQRTVLRMFALGFNQEAIAAQLHMHRNSIYAYTRPYHRLIFNELKAKIRLPTPEREVTCRKLCDFSLVHEETGCWLWLGTKCSETSYYGRIRTAGDRVQTHRASFELFVSDVPADKFVCHHCDTPPCFRPEHLFLGTSADNAADARKKRSQGVETQAWMLRFAWMLNPWDLEMAWWKQGRPSR